MSAMKWQYKEEKPFGKNSSDRHKFNTGS